MCVLVLHEMDFVDQEKKSWLSDSECLGLMTVPFFYRKQEFGDDDDD